ncbi:relaxase MobL [Weissella viridescens]|uniref:relaxase MobL n=1 Tax=Weissella viridescens TaxID=1629 RepID=UPI003AF2A9E4
MVNSTLISATKGSNPDIVIKHRFDPAKSYYVDYLLDHNGRDKDVTDIKNDYDIVKTQLAKQKGEFEDYLSYGARFDVTKLEDDVDETLTTTFTKDTFNLSAQQLIAMQQDVDVAAKNHNLMWKTVVSFSDDFLIREGIMDNAEERHLDQRRIKEVIQKAMPDMLEAEGIDQSAEWFANIHLRGDQNQQHIHVHIGTFEKHTQRPNKFNPDTKRMEPKGLFKRRTINHLKSRIWRNLRQNKSIEKEKNLMVDKDIAAKQLLKHLDDVQYKLDQKKLVNALLEVLPDEKQTKWRAKSNAVDMKAANALANQFVDNLLTKQPELIEKFEKSTSHLNQLYEKGYGENNNQYAQNQRQLLQNKLVNRLYKNIRELEPEFYNAVDPDESYADRLQAHQEIKQALEEQIKDMQRRNQEIPKRVKRELGKQKRAIRVINLEEKQQVNDGTLSELDDYISTTGREVDPLIQYRRDQLVEQNELITLQLKPNFKLTDQEKLRKQALSTKYQTASDSSIDAVSDDYLQAFQAKVDREITLVENSELSAFNIAYSSDGGSIVTKEEVIQGLEKQKVIIQKKGTIHQNNLKMKEPEKDAATIKKENAQLFGEIAQLEGRENTFEARQKVHRKQRSRRDDEKEQRNRPKLAKTVRRIKKVSMEQVESLFRDLSYSVEQSEQVDRHAAMEYEREQQRLERDSHSR